MENLITKIIHIINHPPAYDEYENKPRPVNNWGTPYGEWVGIWGYDWADIIGIEVTKVKSEINYEIWQVDNRADKIYEAEISPRVIHKQFPAIEKKHFWGLKKERYWYSYEILKELNSLNDKNAILLLPASYIHFSKQIEKQYKDKIRILHIHLLNTKLLLPISLKTLNPVRFIHRVLYNIYQLKNIKEIKYLQTSVLEGTKELKKINNALTIFHQRIGVNIDYWKRDKTRQSAREKLKIPQEQFVFLLSQRLVQEYQIDKLLQVISEISSKRDFKFYISGHGNHNYENYLHDLVNKHRIYDKVSFLGYISTEDLKDFMIAADIFMTVPIMFAGSYGAIKAMCLEIPIFHVSEGSTYELLKQYQAGIIVSPTNYQQWRMEIESILNGKDVSIIPRTFLEEYFKWENIAKEWIEIFKKVKGE